MLTASFGTQVVWLKADVIVGASPEACRDDADCFASNPVVWLKADVIVGASPEAWLDDADSVVWNPGGLAEG
jgi:hypothetical protein